MEIQRRGEEAYEIWSKLKRRNVRTNKDTLEVKLKHEGELFVISIPGTKKDSIVTFEIYKGTRAKKNMLFSMEILVSGEKYEVVIEKKENVKRNVFVSLFGLLHLVESDLLPTKDKNVEKVVDIIRKNELQKFKNVDDEIKESLTTLLFEYTILPQLEHELDELEYTEIAFKIIQSNEDKGFDSPDRAAGYRGRQSNNKSVSERNIKNVIDTNKDYLPLIFPRDKRSQSKMQKILHGSDYKKQAETIMEYYSKKFYM